MVYERADILLRTPKAGNQGAGRLFWTFFVLLHPKIKNLWQKKERNGSSMLFGKA